MNTKGLDASYVAELQALGNASASTTATQQGWCEGCSAQRVIETYWGTSGTNLKPSNVVQSTFDSHRLYQC
jgi:hypothetical protein